MDLKNCFYIFYVQKKPGIKEDGQRPRKLVVFYSKDNLEPQLAYELNWINKVPKEYIMLEYLMITLNQYKALIKKFKDTGILQEYGRAIPDYPKETG